jgi:hypothetical protein
VKVDLKQEIPSYRAAHGEFSIVQVPPMTYLAVDGHGDPNTSPEYAAALASLYPLAYAVKFLSKRELERDYVVPPLEALWWSADMASFTEQRDKSRWDWTLLNLVPDWVEPGHVDAARETVARKGVAPSLDRTRLEELDERTVVQTLHIGSYDDEAPLLERMHHGFLPANALRMTGKHHEIYLSDPRRTPPHKLRTILRQPVEGI